MSIRCSGGSREVDIVESVRVGIIGDRDPGKPSHTATDAALDHAEGLLGVCIEVEWLPTELLEKSTNERVERFDAFWCAPGSPYESMDGAIEMIRAVRESGKPFIGTCGGFQHAVIEYARNVIGILNAAHAEYEPDASNLLITPLSCSLAGNRERVELSPDSKVCEFYGVSQAKEKYLCNFGLAPEHRTLLEDGGLRVSGVDRHGEARIVELPRPDFYIATLFVPQMRSSASRPHPLVAAFLRAALDAQSRQETPSLKDII